MENLLNTRNLKAVSLALLLFIYPILVLSTFSVQYLETIHRVTMQRVFDESLFGSTMADSLAAIGLMLLFLSLSSRLARLRIISVAVFATAIAGFVLGSEHLIIGGLVTLPFLTGLLAVTLLPRRSGNTSRPSATSSVQIDGMRVAAVFLVIVIIMEIGALARWISYPLFPTEIYSDPSWKVAELESSLFQSLSLISPILLVLIAFSFLYSWYILDIRKKRTHETTHQSYSDVVPAKPENWAKTHADKPGSGLGGKQSQSASSHDSDALLVESYSPRTSTVTGKKMHLVILSAALVIAPLLALYPHLPGVNPSGSGVSTDEQFYLNWMSKLRANSGASWTNTITSAFTINKGDRPLTILTILTLSNLTGQPDLMVIRFLPVALAPLLALASYVLIRYSLRSKQDAKGNFYASIGAIFAVFSPQVIVGEYAGLLANWLALIISYIALLFLLRGWESRNRNQAVLSFGSLFCVLVVMMLIHLYTWAHFLAVLVLFACLSFIFARKRVVNPSIKVLVILLVVVSTFSIDYARSYYFATPSAAESDSAIVTNVQSQGTTDRWERLQFTLGAYVGGFLSNPIMFLLALVWIVSAKMSNGLNRVLLSMLFIMALPITFGSIEFQTRVLYNIPFHIPAMLALFNTSSRNRTLHLLWIVAISVTLATYALRSMANFYLEIPEGITLDRQFLLP